VSIDSKRRARTALFFSVALTLLVYILPLGALISYPLVLLSTLAHELGHGIAAMMVGCRFEQFVLYSDGSGAAVTSGNPGRIAQAFISAGGLMGPSIAAAGCFYAGRNGRTARTTLMTVGALLAVALVVVIRNAFGWFFVAAVAAVCLYTAAKAKEDTAQLVVLFVGVQLALSVFSRSDYLFTNVAVTATGNGPSDVAKMADALFLPYWMWGLVCGGFSVWVLWRGLHAFIKDTA
jgi:hypothetical protein